MPFTLNVNGKSSTVDVPGDMPLLWVLRDVLNFKGTKFGCGIGQCGACTVHIGGSAVRACQTRSPRSVAASRRSKGCPRTGLTPCRSPGRDSTSRSAAIARPANHVGGRVLAQKPVPTDAQINTAMNGNLCRCGTYVRIREAIRRAATLGNQRSTSTAQGAGAQ